MTIRFLLALVAGMGIAMAASTAFEAQGQEPESSLLAADITLKTDNTVSFLGEVSEESVTEWMTELSEVKGPEVFVMISSPGGSVLAGSQLISFMDSLDTNIVCIVDFAASMAFAILQACDERVGMPHSIYMQHNAAFGLNPAEVPNQLSFIGMITDQLKEMDEMQAQRIGISVKDFQSLYSNDWWVYGMSASKDGVVDRVATVGCSQALIASEVQQTYRTIFGNIDVTYSGCPLLPAPRKVDFGKKEHIPNYRTLNSTQIKKINSLTLE